MAGADHLRLCARLPPKSPRSFLLGALDQGQKRPAGRSISSRCPPMKSWRKPPKFNHFVIQTLGCLVWLFQTSFSGSGIRLVYSHVVIIRREDMRRWAPKLKPECKRTRMDLHAKTSSLRNRSKSIITSFPLPPAFAYSANVWSQLNISQQKELLARHLTWIAVPIICSFPSVLAISAISTKLHVLQNRADIDCTEKQ